MPEDFREEHIGLCTGCRHAKVIRNDRSSKFYQCLRALTDPAYPRYPALPRLECLGFEDKDCTAEKP